MTTFARSVSEGWDWRRSAQWRFVSLVTVWLLLFLSPVLGVITIPLFVVRMAWSTAQLLLNRELQKREPIKARGRPDWVLLALTLLGSITVASIREAHPGIENPLLFLPVLLPFSLIQLRMCVRCYSAASATFGPLVIHRQPLRIS